MIKFYTVKRTTLRFLIICRSIVFCSLSCFWLQCNYRMTLLSYLIIICVVRVVPRQVSVTVRNFIWLITNVDEFTIGQIHRTGFNLRMEIFLIIIWTICIIEIFEPCLGWPEDVAVDRRAPGRLTLWMKPHGMCIKVSSKHGRLRWPLLNE